MTYQEIKDRLTKCESTLESLKNGSYSNIQPTEVQKTVKQLKVLQESLQSQLAEASKKTYLVTPKSGETSALSLDDKEVDALEDADDIEGIKGADGSEVKEMSDDEFAQAQQNQRLEDHPEKDMIKKIQALIAKEKKIKEGEVSEAPEGMYYIKISKDAASQNKAQVIFNDLYDVKYELNDDPDGVIMYFKKEDFDAGIMDDLEGDGVQILDTNIPDVNEDAEEDAKNDADYAQGWHDDPRQDEDTDVGHQDDEPSMLGASAMETAEYAAKLVKKLQRYDQHDGEVDFPNWWQKKLILARDYISAAYHYLDSEEKQPAIDQLALESKVNEGRGDLQTIVGIIEDRAAESGFSVEDEAEEVIEAIQDHYKLNDVEENVDKVAGGIPYRQHGNKVIISEPLDDATKERLIGKAKEHGYFAQPNMAGGITITLKKGMYEELDEMVDPSYADMLAQFIILMGSGYGALQAVKKLGDETGDISLDSVKKAIQKHKGQKNEEVGGQSISDLKPGDKFEYNGKSFTLVKHKEGNIATVILPNGDTSTVSFGGKINTGKKAGIGPDAFGQGKGHHIDEASLAKIQKAHSLVVAKMKELVQHYKTGDTSVVPQLKDLTAKKKELERQLDDKVAGTGRDQELSIQEAESTCCGKCGRKHVKGTKCKTPYLKGKDHCRTR